MTNFTDRISRKFFLMSLVTLILGCVLAGAVIAAPIIAAQESFIFISTDMTMVTMDYESVNVEGALVADL